MFPYNATASANYLAVGLAQGKDVDMKRHAEHDPIKIGGNIYVAATCA